ncbi:MAG: UDP-N-acetylmuramoyl-L-alanyl-D-glutamate--2,6-diaminopimelate ligase [Pseudomonadota bacterium]
MYPKQLSLQEIQKHFESVDQLLVSSQLPRGEFVSGVTVDSRAVRPGFAFVAIKGHAQDGHNFIEAALKLGASLIICELPQDPSVPHVCVSHSRQAWAYLEDLRYGHPGRELKVIGVTGTNGKSSAVWMISHLLNSLGQKTAMIGTLGSKLAGSLEPTSHTTPDPDQLFKLLRDAVSGGAKCVAMEVSSHALAQGKVSPLRFAGAIFTSFSRDHLDFHPSMEHYFEAKWALFSLVLPDGFKLMHQDIVYTAPVNKLRIDNANIEYYGLSSGPYGFSYTLNTLTFHTKDSTLKAATPYLGALANTNLVGSLMAVMHVAEIPLSEIMAHVASLPQVPGRFEFVGKSKSGGLVYTDYAHTPDAIQKAALAIKDAYPGRKLRILFGCGGDRDRGKRPLMGSAAAKECEAVYLTSDNPRSEEPKQIIDDIYKGCLEVSLGAEIILEVDREEAIRKAISSLSNLSILVIAGKGHETYQIIKDIKIPFDDREVAKKYLNT